MVRNPSKFPPRPPGESSVEPYDRCGVGGFADHVPCSALVVRRYFHPLPSTVSSSMRCASSPVVSKLPRTVSQPCHHLSAAWRKLVNQSLLLHGPDAYLNLRGFNRDTMAVSNSTALVRHPVIVQLPRIANSESRRILVHQST